MSENNKPTPQNEEVDLGQLFQMIGRVFEKIGSFISSVLSFLLFILGKIGIFILLSINIVKRRIIPLVTAAAIGIFLSFVLSKTFKKSYQSELLIQQNYKTGNIFYNQIEALSAMANQSDSVELANALKIPVSVASKIKNFSISSVANQNNLMLDYFEFVKKTDSTLTLTFDEYVTNTNLEDSREQVIKVESIDPKVFSELASPIVNSILDNDFIEILKERELNNLKRIKSTISSSIEKSDSLQSNYFNLLEKYYRVDSQGDNRKKPEFNFNLGTTSKDKINTKEYDLFLKTESMREDLDRLENEIESKRDIINIQKGFSPPKLIKKSILESKLFSPILFVILLFLFFLIKELGFRKILKQYGNKESLLKKN